ncbi:zinc finger MYM-type protein 1-like [Gymnodraco acuticeps]|uniref:Zinc finger MYM-type protein 1-like n=1 Tax=Gymnodraco acuticeps TaxID=8218 RepID=A0A6P8W4P2_GYMAC|nr:zinc finger MYM-type protein 1-like [Gymnodraco acuticeps]
MKRKGNITYFFNTKSQRTENEDKREGNEKGEESTVERPGGSEHEKATEGDEDMDREEVDVRNEEEGSDSERGTEAGSEKEAEADGRKAVTTLAGPHDISKCKGDAAVQPNLKTFPKTLHGAAKRSFHKEWYSSWPWLEYSLSQDAAYCFACRHFVSAKASVFTAEHGYSNWKKATSKDSGFSVHARSDTHVNAMIAWTEYKSMAGRNTTILGMMGDENQKQVTENQKYIKTLADILLLTATQNISQRGHDESETSKNKGNFLEILDVVSKHDPLVKRRLSQGPRNAKYTSKGTQNEMLECLAEIVREDIIKEVKESEHFFILADETKDMKKIEQLSLVVRYYYNGVVQESFLEYQQAEHLDAASLTKKIISCLEKYGLEYKKNLVGQGYDGAAVMSGRCSGVQTRVKEAAKYAFYVHCNAHCLNLVIVDCVKSVPEAACFFMLLERLYTFMSGSYVHNNWMDVQKEMFTGAPRELPRLSDTRWACRYAACRNLMDRLTAVIRVLDDISDEANPQRAVDCRATFSN